MILAFYPIILQKRRKKAEPKRPKTANASSGTERILVVDDEAQVAKITGLSLSRDSRARFYSITGYLISDPCSIYGNS